MVREKKMEERINERHLKNGRLEVRNRKERERTKKKHRAEN